MLLLSLALLVLVVLVPLAAETPVGKPATGAKEAADADRPRSDDLTERSRETRHTLTLGGKRLRYTATAGLLPLREELKDPKAYVFYVAYTKADEKSASRPLTFCFNGGPGSASVWLHLGAFGPQRVVVPDPPEVPQPPYRLTKNAETLLDVTDLVFVDPVSTGFSRPLKDDERAHFHGVKEDVEWVGEFVRLFCTRYGRWGSPKFLAGESYGTLRAAGLAQHLQARHGMYLNGLILISTVLNAITLDFERGNDIGHVLLLPTITATAWYHGRFRERTTQALGQRLRAAEAFAQGAYAAALFQGAALPAQERKQVVKRLSELTTLPEEFIDRADLRLTVNQVMHELLRDERLTVGRLDSRYAAPAPDPGSHRQFGDPGHTLIHGAFATLLNRYVRETLKFESDLPYEILTRRVQPWKWQFEEGGARGYVTVIPALREALVINPHLKVFVASGYFDMATPYFASEHTFNHLGLTASRMPAITRAFYRGGHMLYTEEVSRRALKRDLAKFYRDAT
jgi:carboxypeptidase C (cathepsin A)